MQQPVRVLVVDDEPGLREVISRRLAYWGFACETAAGVSEAELVVETFAPDLVISDVVMPGATGIDLLRRLKAGQGRRLPIILMTAHATVDIAVEAMKEGAEDFLIKPVDDEKLKLVVDAVVDDIQLERSARRLDAVLRDDTSSMGLVGNSEAMVEVRRLLHLVAESDTSVLITGESGTGKEVVARAIHSLSGRSARPFVAVNTAAIPETLVESELFGHEKGAFTGAIRDRAGCFEQADRGSLFLDEIAEMPMQLQPKLLRILEGGRVRRLGASRETPFDVRLIAATNRDPAEAIERGLLREDLYYRLAVFEIVIPPLRARIDDLPLLCQSFIGEFNRKHGTEVEGLRDSTLECLRGYGWKGNVRELRNLVERAVIVSRGRWLEPSHFPAYVRSTEGRDEQLMAVPLGTSAAEAEIRLILRTLEMVGNNKAEAARRLGIDVKTIRNKLKRLESSPLPEAS